MELILLIIYSVIVWLIFFKFKLLPWNITSQVIVVTIPIIALTILILFMNICAPSSSDVRAQNYVIPIVPRVTGQVTEVPIEPNRPIKKGDVLFKIDPVPFDAAEKAAEATLRAAERRLSAASIGSPEERTALFNHLDLAALPVCEVKQVAEARGDTCRDSAERVWCYVENDPNKKPPPARPPTPSAAVRNQRR